MRTFHAGHATWPGRVPSVPVAFFAIPLIAAFSCGDPERLGPADDTPVPDTVRIALTALGTGTYHGFAGGLYPDGANEAPSDHAVQGAAARARIRPLDASGAPSPTGRIVLLSIGMSNTTQEFCQPTAGGQNCRDHTFGGQAAADPAVDHGMLAIVDGAAGGQTAGTWDSPADPNYDRVREQRLAARGLAEAQVQIIWLKVANANPTRSLPDANADAVTLVRQMGDIVRAARTRYPNLQQVFVSSRIYAGYATTTLNPEPYAYESGFAVKWLIAAQIEQSRQGRIVDERAGDLHPDRAPWLAWGPYLWADGANPRPDGLVWERADLANDGTHPSQSGQRKVGTLLLTFFRNSTFTQCWFTGTPCS
jgi:hypothetical protein